MTHFWVFLFFYSVPVCVLCDTHLTDDEYELLPPIFKIDLYDKCVEKNHLFCRIHLKLFPMNETHSSPVWKLIEKTKLSKRFYNHEELYYGVCINRTSLQDFSSIKETISKQYSYKGLKTSVISHDCKEPEYNSNNFETFIIFAIFLYISITLLATYYHHILVKRTSKMDKYLIVFSVRHNLSKLGTIYARKEIGQLNCIQALRFYTTVMIIFCHTFCSFTGGYVASTKYLEDIPLNFPRNSLRIWFVFLVQTFFLISAWLLSYHTFKIFKNDCTINYWKYILLTFFNRYLRIIPPVLLMVCLWRTPLVYHFVPGPLMPLYAYKEYERCSKNWWVNLLFLNNHYREDEMCYFTTWYLAADTQLYLLSLTILLLMVKIEKIKILIMALSLAGGVAIPSIISYIYELDFIFRITPENSKNNMFLTFAFSATYSSTYANMASYMLGIILGYLHFHCEENPKLTPKFYKLPWIMFAIGLPICVIIVSNFEYNRITTTLLAGILRPLYALGFGIGIFGISKQSKGILHKICSWKPVLFLSNFTYSTYVVHFGIVFIRTATTKVPFEISDSILFFSFIKDTLISFIGGFLVHLTLEMPCAQLQHLIVSKYSITNTLYNKKS